VWTKFIQFRIRPMTGCCERVFHTRQWFSWLAERLTASQLRIPLRGDGCGFLHPYIPTVTRIIICNLHQNNPVNRHAVHIRSASRRRTSACGWSNRLSLSLCAKCRYWWTSRCDPSSLGEQHPIYMGLQTERAPNRFKRGVVVKTKSHCFCQESNCKLTVRGQLFYRLSSEKRATEELLVQKLQ
jgi:hypothetical protein